MFEKQFFSHIYVEKQAKDFLASKQIINKFPSSTIIEIEHYKDVFSRYKNNFRLQKDSLKIILAKKESGFLYPINKFIQSQNQENFYYSSMVLNCLYDCEYCLLQGMHQSSYIVIFVNTDDFFNEISKKLSTLDSMFLSISYDSDLLAFEHITSFISLWIEFANKNKKLSLEIRTKSSNFKHIQNLYNENTILSFTLSPLEVIERFEHKTASLEARVKSINNALRLNWKVSLVFDPIIDIENASDIYRKFLIYLKKNIEFDKIESIVIGTFRLNSDFLKNIQKTKLQSSLLYYPYKIENKTVSYESHTKDFLINLVKSELINIIQKDNIFIQEDI